MYLVQILEDLVRGSEGQLMKKFFGITYWECGLGKKRRPDTEDDVAVMARQRIFVRSFVDQLPKLVEISFVRDIRVGLRSFVRNNRRPRLAVEMWFVSDVRRRRWLRHRR